MQTNCAIGGDNFKLTRNNFFYHGPNRRVLVTDQAVIDEIEMLITYDNVFALLSLFKELGGDVLVRRHPF